MITNESELSDALRRLAASAPQHAPGRVEQKLIEYFRRRQLRKRMVWTSAIAAVAVAAGTAVVVLTIPPMPGPPRPVVVHAAPPPIPLPEATVVAQAPKKPSRVRISGAEEVATTFYALPDADNLPPAEDTTVVRVRLPRSAMRMVGLPVNEERVNERIQADVMLGQDGLMRAVRFVQ